MTKKTQIVNCRKEQYDVYIGRPSIFGNPFKDMPRLQAIGEYAKYFHERINNDPEFKKAVLGLYGKTLGCFCHPYPCHGNVIVDWLELYHE